MTIIGNSTIQKLNDAQFKKLSNFVYKEIGIKLTEQKRELLNARISKRMQKLGIQPKKYLVLVDSDANEREKFLDAISTNHTFFFRESKAFKFLDASCRDIWCAASSSGEEPYSLAIHCMNIGFQPSILATDISDESLAKGENAIYPVKATGNIPKQFLRAYFQKGSAKWDGYVRLKNTIKNMVNFRKFNLLKDNLPSKTFDILFCRNVMIYFDNPTREYVVNKLSRVLKKGGYFIIGGAESLNGLNHNLEYIEPSVYKKY